MQSKGGSKVVRGIARTFLVIILTVLMILVFAMGLMMVLTHGPSVAARDLFVQSMNETSALKFLPHLVLSDEQVEAILSPASEETDAAPVEEDVFVDLPYEDGTVYEEAPAVSEITEAAAGVEFSFDENGVQILDVKGPLFAGKLMVIEDPAQVVVGSLESFSYSVGGKFLEDYMEMYDAIGGTNAGGFYDPNGGGNGGIPGYGDNPNGLVIRDGKITWGSLDGYYYGVFGFDGENKLHVATGMSGQEALNLGLVSASNFPSYQNGPVLIQDGVKQENLGGGTNPRTALGQRADGTVLLLVTEGRKVSALGATYDDLADIMSEYGAVNAINLDGGSSSLMYYNGEMVLRGSNLLGMRPVPTCILVLKRG